MWLVMTSCIRQRRTTQNLQAHSSCWSKIVSSYNTEASSAFNLLSVNPTLKFHDQTDRGSHPWWKHLVRFLQSCKIGCRNATIERCSLAKTWKENSRFGEGRWAQLKEWRSITFPFKAYQTRDGSDMKWILARCSNSRFQLLQRCMPMLMKLCSLHET